MSQTLGASPGSKKYPDHHVRISDGPARATASIGGIAVADSRATLAVDETGYERVIYFPRSDVDTDLLVASDSRTICPFKGEARYFASAINGTVSDVAWYYPSVYDEVAPIEGYVAFYADKVTLEYETP